jgi:hypothetical protein
VPWLLDVALLLTVVAPWRVVVLPSVAAVPMVFAAATPDAVALPELFVILPSVIT